jgi:hypothetical protein
MALTGDGNPTLCIFLNLQLRQVPRSAFDEHQELHREIPGEQWDFTHHAQIVWFSPGVRMKASES